MNINGKFVMELGLVRSSRIHKVVLARLMTCAAFLVLIAACGGGEPEELTFDLEISDRQFNIVLLKAFHGDTLTLIINSDELGEVHIHGYDYQEDVSPGEQTVIIFEAHATGKFNITFHSVSTYTKNDGHEHNHDDGNDSEESEVLLGSLEVRPR
jgi:hypothetical protein